MDENALRVEVLDFGALGLARKTERLK